MAIEQDFAQFTTTARAEFANRQITLRRVGIPTSADITISELPVGTFYIDVDTNKRYEKRTNNEWEEFSGNAPDSVFWTLISESESNNSYVCMGGSENLLVDTTSISNPMAEFEIWLPTAPIPGETFNINPLTQNYNINKLTILAEGENQNGKFIVNGKEVEGITIDEVGLAITLTYISTLIGWVMSKSGDTVIINHIDANGVSGIVTTNANDSFIMKGEYDFTGATVTGLDIPSIAKFQGSYPLLTSASFTVEHNLNSSFITITVWDVSSGKALDYSITIIDDNNVEIELTEEVPAESLNIVIIG